MFCFDESFLDIPAHPVHVNRSGRHGAPSLTLETLGPKKKRRGGQPTRMRLGAKQAKGPGCGFGRLRFNFSHVDLCQWL